MEQGASTSNQSKIRPIMGIGKKGEEREDRAEQIVQSVRVLRVILS